MEKNDAQKFVDYVTAFADSVAELCRDKYGEKKSLLLADGVNTQTGEPLKWERIHALPDHVFFDHRPHINAEILCQICHGEVQNMNLVYQSMSMRMSNCLGCHRDPHDAVPNSNISNIHTV